MKSSVPVLASGLLLLAGCAESSDNVVEDPAVVDSTGAQQAAASVDAPVESAIEPNEEESAAVEAPATPASPEEQLASLTGEYDEKYAGFLAAYRSAETQEDKSKAMAMMPQGDDFAEKFLALAEANPESSSAVDALIWVSEHSRGEMLERANARLLTDHSSDARLLPIIFMMMYSREDGTEAQLRELTKSSEASVRGVATFALGSFLMKKDDQSPEAKMLLQSVVDDYSDVSFDMRGNDFKIAPKAEGALFALNNLQIGMMAPDIQGVDLDGVDFKLSEYRGKVVLLDFWGNW